MKHSVYHDTIIRINLDNISYNLTQIRKMLGEQVQIAAVIKGNGYGHGAVAIAPTLMTNGVSLLAVATLAEAIQIKEVYADYPVLVMGLTADAYLPYLLDFSIIQTIDSLHQARLLNDLAATQQTTVTVHLKYDTGFHRLGFPDDSQSIEQIKTICSMRHLNVAGIYSHLALTDDESNQLQYQKFTTLIDQLSAQGIHIPIQHITDSIACVDYPEYRMNMVRAGAIIYGLKGFHKGVLDLRQALTFQTKINHITQLKAGEGVSYDYLWKAPCETRVATLPFGYADGYPRNLRDKGWVMLHGKKAPVIGVICMDQCMIDLTDIQEAEIGDEVIIYGDGTNEAPDIDTISKLAGTNKNEIVVRLTNRPARVYDQSTSALS